MRHRWTDSERSRLVALAYEVKGDGPALIARASSELGFSVTRDMVDRQTRAIGRPLGELLEHARHAAPEGAAVVPAPPAAPPERRDAPEFNPPPLRPPSADGVERRLIMADLHMPVHSVHAVTCALQIARVLQPHVIIIAGDLLNLNALSRHPDYAVARETFDSGALAARAFLRALRRSVGGRIVYLEGNHEKWSRDYAVLNPRHEGTFNIPIALGIAPRPDPEDPGLVMDIEWVPEERQPLILGPVAYLHGTNGGEHFCKRYAGDIGPRCGVKQVIVGHHHAFQHYSHKNGIEAWGCGYLGDGRSEAFDYAKNPRGWQQGVLLQDVTPDGLVTTWKIPIVGGRALVAGRVIAAA